MIMIKVGIDLISFYTPSYFLDLEQLAMVRGIDPNKLRVGLGQEKMAVIPPDEDIITMAADAGARVLQKTDAADIDLLLFATESAVDQSKAAGVYVHRLLNLPSRCRVVELKQACYGATAGIQLALPMLREGSAKKILIIAADIARYGLQTSGESSQGGGAVAMVLTRNPRILSIEPESGFHTEDVMDFWRPNYREEAIVDGKYSCELYLRLVQKTWEQYAALSQRTFSDHARFCYHVPVPKLVEKAHQCLAKLNGLPKLSSTEIDTQLGASLQYGRQIGNCYTAALYLGFVSLLENTAVDLSRQRIGFYSYGSGCIAEFFSGVVEENYRDMLDTLYHQKLLSNRQALTPEEYERFYNFSYPTDGSQKNIPECQPGRYRLTAIQQHKRIYTTA
jgi:hydroxymethylglutaryl-CoA synthase